MSSRKKQEENHLKILKDLLAQPSNKKCLECDQRGPTYVDVTIGSFVCTSCGGLLRGLNPPHRVKSISMTTFTPTEISFIESHGNEWCRAVYLAKYDEQSKAKPESRSDHNKLKHFLELKYEQKKWYESPSQQRKLMESVAAAAKKNRENLSPPVKPLNSLIGNVADVQIPSAKHEISREITRKVNRPSTDLLSGGTLPDLISPVSRNSSKLISQQTPNAKKTGFSDGFADFDSVFGGEFSTTTNVNAASASTQNSLTAFDHISSQPLPFTTNTSSHSSNLTQKIPAASNNAADKYAALADLDLVFGKVEPQPAEKSQDFFWSSPVKPAQSSNSTIQQPAQQSLFGISPAYAQQNTLFPVANMNVAPASSSLMTNPTASSSWSSTASNWNTWNQTYPTNVSSNPFFTPSANNMQIGNDYGPWIQPQNQMSSAPANQTAMSSTNPFAVGGPGSTQPSPYQAQPLNQMQQHIQRPTINNPSNPFMF